MAGKPKPLHLRVLNGNPGKRGISREIREQVKATLEANARTARPGSAPAWMTPGAKATWRRIVGERGLVWLDSSDRELLASFCTAYARMVASEKAIAEHGLTYETVNGGVGTRPEVRTSIQCAALVRSLGSELGLSPAARARLGAPPREKTRASDLPPELSSATEKPAGA
jgi:P27 family predicted phage terminase small subunit